MSRSLLPNVAASHGRALYGREPLIFHCNHYNHHLQQTLLLPDIGMEEVIRDAAASVAYAAISKAGDTPEARAKVAADTFAELGFGTIDFSKATAEGGVVVTPTSHYGQMTKLAREEPGTNHSTQQSFFDQGYAAGALAAIHGLPARQFAAKAVSCLSVGDSEGRIELSKHEHLEDRLYRSAANGFGSGDVAPPPYGDTSVDEGKTLEALSGLDFSGNEEGFIPRFGVVLTRHFANFYNRISFEFVHRMSEMGLLEAAEDLLVNAGYHCAFNTFGGIMTSAEWDAVIKPQCQTKADWVHGMVATVNALGWGTWRVAEISDDKLVVRIYDDYESRGYVGLYGTADRPICYLARAGVVGTMNLVHVGDIASKPTLDRDFFVKVFESPDGFKVEETKCMAMGDDYTEIVAWR
ncbi:MAG: hypothetical protein ACE366_07325 [Bradymonadia bacterium]